ncbi:iron-containing alcohol dehydrogenase [Basfia succiniciproducens]|uniref:EutG protein n=1 Tax=Mannheimia succiniciproducens (strain KCTC 0769BP / MBEL55E) TaxID=221988 RepID=Q65WI4_MANSM|nr:iron-containing alcohol dehydrogenase [[Mannheimia] succiniciproducens]AAU36676.1 EutG protein [[Mannheimia] succiniciproducens MBEL55E]
MTYSLLHTNKVIAGAGCVAQITDVVNSFDATNVVIITDQGVFNAGLINEPKMLLEQAGVNVHVISDTPPEPPVDKVNDIYKVAMQFNVEMVIGIGGGSAMDTAKLVAILLNNHVALRDVVDGKVKFKNRGIPTLMIPTTSGTGSEATQNSIVLVPERELKVGIVDEKMLPNCVILDPKMTTGLPKHITANTGIDALCHAIECYISKKCSPFTEMFALKSIELIAKSIRIAYEDGHNLQARENMLLGSYLGGVSIATSSTVAVHALSYPLGGKYHIPHGLSNAILLPDVMKFNLDACVEKFARIAKAMDLNIAGLTEQEAAEAMIEELYALIRDLNIKCDLKTVGITEDILDELVDAGYSVRRLLDNNPKEMTKQDIRGIYKKIL